MARGSKHRTMTGRRLQADSNIWSLSFLPLASTASINLLRSRGAVSGGPNCSGRSGNTKPKKHTNKNKHRSKGCSWGSLLELTEFKFKPVVSCHFAVHLSHVFCAIVKGFFFLTLHCVFHPDWLLALSIKLLCVVSPAKNTFSFSELHKSLIVIKYLVVFINLDIFFYERMNFESIKCIKFVVKSFAGKKICNSTSQILSTTGNFHNMTSAINKETANVKSL